MSQMYDLVERSIKQFEIAVRNGAYIKEGDHSDLVRFVFEFANKESISIFNDFGVGYIDTKPMAFVLALIDYDMNILQEDSGFPEPQYEGEQFTPMEAILTAFPYRLCHYYSRVCVNLGLMTEENGVLNTAPQANQNIH